jgi:secreted PhoX family phosphatase
MLMKTPKLPALSPLFTLPVCAGVLLLAAGAARAQNMYVADWDAPGAIYVYAPGSQTHTTFYSGGTSSLGEPEQIAFDSAGNLYVDDSAGGNVYKITSGGTKTTFASGLNNPSGMAFDSAGDLYVSGDQGNFIDEFKYTGGSLSTIATPFTTSVDNPTAIAFDKAGDLFESDHGTGNIYEYKNNSGTLSGTPTLYASGFGNPFGLAFNTAGYLYVAYDGNNGATAGGVTEIVGNTKVPIVTGLDVPNNIAFDNSGNLFITDSDDGEITEVSTGNTVTSWAVGNNATGLAFQGIALPVPEPSTYALLALGAAGIFVRRLKK